MSNLSTKTQILASLGGEYTIHSEELDADIDFYYTPAEPGGVALVEVIRVTKKGYVNDEWPSAEDQEHACLDYINAQMERIQEIELDCEINAREG